MNERADHLALRDDPERFGVSIEGARLKMEGVDLASLAARVGTPAYVYGADHIEARYRELADGLASRAHGSLICYAVKANSSQAVLRHLANLGAGADIVSGGELKRALAAGVPAERIVFSGVGKTHDEIDAALDAGIRSINAESREEIDQLAERARTKKKPAPVSLRINPDVDPDTHPYLATGLREAKFGIAMEDGLELALDVHRNPDLELVGLACHIGSQIVDTAPFLDSLSALRQLIEGLRAQGVELKQLDLGGGLGIPYRGEDKDLDPGTWVRALVDATADLEVPLLIEPGRYLVGNAGVLLTRVLARKRGETRNFVIVDAAMNDLLRPALYEAYHAIVPTQLPPEDAPLHDADVVGPICECGDFLAQGRSMPRPEVGEVLAVLSAGAYGMTMASNYNTRPLAPEVMVSGERWAITRPRQSVDELIGQESYPAWFASASDTAK